MALHIGTYLVPVKTQEANQKAILTPAEASDMPQTWSFPWCELWRNNRTEGMGIIKLAVNNEVWGLIQYGIFPRKNPSFVVIDHLESNPVNRGKIANRLVEPVGKWLIWYCVNVGLQYCPESEKLVLLFSKAGAFDYYRKVGMTYKGTVDLSPGEKVHEFEFTREGAIEYSLRQEKNYGNPTPISINS